MLTFPNCKINLGLCVTEKRSDGFHNIESIFVPIDLHDVLEVIPSDNDTLTFEVSGIEINTNLEDNICVKAYRMLQKNFSLSSIKAHLHKNIPTGAGLGGGSADGAFMLKLLNQVFELNMGMAQLEEYATMLGSDCPFFIENKPSFVSGRGELLQPIDIDMKGDTIVLVKPNIHVSTAKAFSMINPRKAGFDLRGIGSLMKVEWKQYITNDFEMPVFQQHPELKVTKEKLYEAGAYYASMSGSGSTVYGLFQSEVPELMKEFSSHYFIKTTKAII